MLQAIQGLPANSALEKVSARGLHIVWVFGICRLNVVAAAFLQCPAVALSQTLSLRGLDNHYHSDISLTSLTTATNV
jgi:hypothetical protein